MLSIQEGQMMQREMIYAAPPLVMSDITYKNAKFRRALEILGQHRPFIEI